MNKLKSPSSEDAFKFVPSLVIGPVVQEKKMKMWKVYDNNNDNDNGQILIRTAHFSLWLRWAKKNWNIEHKKSKLICMYNCITVSVRRHFSEAKIQCFRHKIKSLSKFLLKRYNTCTITLRFSWINDKHHKKKHH